VVVPVNSLLLPAEIKKLLPPSTTSNINSTGLVEPRSVLTVLLTGVHPRLAPILPNLSITQLSASRAKPLDKEMLDSWRFSPKNPGAAIDAAVCLLAIMY
jgi:hypothetical protein